MSNEPSSLKEAIQRSSVLKTDKLAITFEQTAHQEQLATALEAASNLPKVTNYHEGRGRGFNIWDMTQGMRVFGWTHVYNVPWLLHWLSSAW